MNELFRRTGVMSHDVVQPLAFTVIPDLSGPVMRRGLPGAWRCGRRMAVAGRSLSASPET